MTEISVREKTVRDYIYELANPELCHDYETEVNRIIAMLDAKERDEYNRTEQRIVDLRRKMEEKDIIISSLTETVSRLKGYV